MGVFMPGYIHDQCSSVNMINVNILCDHFDMENMGSRLRAARIAAGFKSARSAAIRFNWLPSTYAAHENGQNEFDAEAAAKYAKAFQTTAARLLIGESESLSQPKAIDSAVASDIGKPVPEAILEVDVRAGAGGGGVPAVAYVVSDDNGNTYAAEGIRDQWIIPGSIVREMLHAAPKHIRVFEVIGDSMEPRLNEGDRVFVDVRYRVPSPEGIFALWDGLGVVIKRVQVVRGSDPLKLKIISANEQYEPYEATIEEVNIIGRYAGRFTVS